MSVGCDAPSTSKRPPTDTCSVLQSVEPEDATRQANDCSSAANSGTSTTSLIDLSTPLQSSITPLESAQSLLPQSAHACTNRFWPLFLNALTASKHVHLGTESTNGCIIKKEGKSAVNRGLPKIFDT